MDIPIDIMRDFDCIWQKRTWYDVLGYDIIWINNVEEIRKFIQFHGLIINCDDDYYNYSRVHIELPPNPCELFRLKGFGGIMKEFSLVMAY